MSSRLIPHQVHASIVTMYFKHTILCLLVQSLLVIVSSSSSSSSPQDQEPLPAPQYRTKLSPIPPRRTTNRSDTPTFTIVFPCSEKIFNLKDPIEIDAVASRSAIQPNTLFSVLDREDTSVSELGYFYLVADWKAAATGAMPSGDFILLAVHVQNGSVRGFVKETICF
ncbi:predicted protein [Thalassiosira pseudonana CCMP1335]|jgi:hypothetical protein|uniref:Uncharacterized protein n=1 Tax=Thalassiosira pseudonana TaxID=35128 RepID=B8LEG4_THAPS|nr:predicted protein [Thalassiosira pseudonana CCMP1335]EED86289.1 predicted protein [Thalassiosira pseudonana CCMP1335]|eukprot:g11555.t1 g11555   contig6:71873-72376(-)